MNEQAPTLGWLRPVLAGQAADFAARDRGITRATLDAVAAQVKAPHVLIITGLRRAGKSTLMAQIADRYFKAEDYYTVNFDDERFIGLEVTDFDKVHEALISLFGERTTFFFDEIQNIPQWERFVRRLHDQGYKIIVTGSNASLLSQEFGTRLTGRSTTAELFPFSFNEYLSFIDETPAKKQELTTAFRGSMIRWLREYSQHGGIPDALKYPDMDVHHQLYNDVIYRDIVGRYKPENIKQLKELAFFVMSNPGAAVSSSKLKQHLRLGSVNTVISYLEYLENSWLIATVYKYADSVRSQQLAPRKVYPVDTGLAWSIGFSTSPNWGHLLESVVYAELRRRHRELFYYRTASDREVDFYIPQANLFIQVAQNLDGATKDRELLALREALKEKPSCQGLILTEDWIDPDSVPGIDIQPIYQWLRS